ncbi:LysR family transcriptional regulator [Rhodobacteraceae bacterium XHP0102]|nr:LysR family transcriptional regulator [Rhodobacteraceae bacterium XHP0102]
MTRPDLKGISLKSLETFEVMARTGSLSDAAEEMGLSVPAASQQLRNLSLALGVELIDTRRRPVGLTPAGRLFLKRVEVALDALRLGQKDLNRLNLSGISALGLGVIDDFENDLTPKLAARLAEALSDCKFRLQTGASHNLLNMLAKRNLDMILCAAPNSAPADVIEHPILRDPYILALPKSHPFDGNFEDLQGLAFLGRDPAQVMARHIDDYLASSGVTVSRRFEIDSNQSISALVAAGLGYTITTPLSLMRGERFADGIDTYPLPQPALPRQIMLYCSDDWTGPIPHEMASLIRDLAQKLFITPARDRMPWLGSEFCTLPPHSPMG